ncbi:MAG TPA: DNA-directed RNA polymerase subunit beta [Syntrophorhabdaceae bacterium]|nr:DNA-directed RNA polymerase subunit beta [Syntrophorhabdaceae bacterium]HPC67536.1 DNA-directed RNA polymerase subunit beta [Syntrophorhabdaceae bacterium]HQH43724.1 DNA-directed RNA polymerase subunit beta [Syntrophorhabdaceae bacterium]HRV23344.1 DNA-directed RNA polymerase subunit beta [Syntrophorhabdaceae bacterium]
MRETFHNKIYRKKYGEIKEVLEIPNLIEIQLDSYEKFLQKDVPPDKRENIGLQAVFKSVFPIKDSHETTSLEFKKYEIGEPKNTEEECIFRGITYAAPMKVTIMLVVWNVDPETKTKDIKAVKEQDVYFGEIPLMTERGTFIINGTERVIVSQLHRSPGVYFDCDQSKSLAGGNLIYTARIIPYRGSWLDFEFDHKELLYVRIDKKKKIPVTLFLKALGYEEKEILDYFYDKEKIIIKEGRFLKQTPLSLLVDQRSPSDITDETGKLLVKKHKKITKSDIKKLAAANINAIPIEEDDIVGKVTADNIYDPETKEVLIPINKELTKEDLAKIVERNIDSLDILFIDNLNVSPSLRNTLLIDKITKKEDALLEIYRKLRPGDPPTIEFAEALINNMFFSEDRYDLSKVGRLKINHRLGFEESKVPLDCTILRKEDIIEVVRRLLKLKDSRGPGDDIDHLGNRRVRTVGELLENQFRMGLVRMERAIKERLTFPEMETLMPHDLVNPKPVNTAIKDFFASSQLSQFMDQTNPLSEITHKRRLSALGPGGLTRERAGFEVRDVHPTHYGRICPVETPEGPNIGLIASLSTYAKVNEFGFIEAPYRKVVNGRVTDEVHYLSALEEENYYIAQANAPIGEDGRLAADMISAQKGGGFYLVSPEQIDYMDVSPKQLVSVSAALIPFLEHDDANRALMGSNMQRQAVPLIKPEAPLIGTGMERIVGRDSRVTVVAKHSGIVKSVDANRIIVQYEEVTDGEEPVAKIDIYNLLKFRRSNQDTCINQRVIVKEGDYVKKGDVLADGPSTDRGELALGKNVFVAFMPWRGFNYEDSVLINERLVKEDAMTSIHIEELECVVRDTKLGREEVTRDIPNIGDEALKYLDESGIIMIGANVRPNDILVGKVTPKGETQLTPEEKLLRAIFGEKAGDVKDTSLRVPHGIEGIVIDVKVLSRRGIDKDDRSRLIEDIEISNILKDQEEQVKIIIESTKERIKNLLLGRHSPVDIKDNKGKIIVKKGDTFTVEKLNHINVDKFQEIEFGDEDIDSRVSKVFDSKENQIELIKLYYEDKINKIKKGDELPPGVIKTIKVYVAMKRKIAVGDKISGRHGNKGIVSVILPEEDMPFMEDGTPIDIVLNPLGVPSRMNAGQILETHLGWAAKELGKKIGEMIDNYNKKMCSPEVIREHIKKIYNSDEINNLIDKISDEELLEFSDKLRDGINISVPVFDGPKEEDIRELFRMAEMKDGFQTTLYDGRTGEPFHHKITVGYMYFLKLHHLVDDKIHARSIGPYSLVTQQPLGGKAQFGGQRLGEMEVWALEGYGAAYSLQEFLTIKSDDVSGRIRAYEAIVKGEDVLEPSLPESFNVLIQELKSLCINVDLVKEE